MNKKLIVLIVALECVFSIFLISIFGPMLEMLHTPADVAAIHILDENGNRLERGTVIELKNDARSYDIAWEVLPSDAENPEVKITVFVDDEEIAEDDADPAVRVTKYEDSARITFRTKKPARPVRIMISSTDGSAVTAYIEFTFAINDEPSHIDPIQ